MSFAHGSIHHSLFVICCIASGLDMIPFVMSLLFPCVAQSRGASDGHLSCSRTVQSEDASVGPRERYSREPCSNTHQQHSKANYSCPAALFYLQHMRSAACSATGKASGVGSAVGSDASGSWPISVAIFGCIADALNYNGLLAQQRLCSNGCGLGHDCRPHRVPS